MKSITYDQSLLSVPIYDEQARYLAAMISKKSELELAQWMKLSEKLALETSLKYKDFTTNTIPKSPAILTYTGDVYTGLNAISLTKKQLKFTENHVRIISGLYGYLQPLDGIHQYRLEMAATNIHAKIKSLYNYWNSKIADQLNKELELHKEKIILNLASDEYSKCILPYTYHRVLHFNFLENKNGKLSFISTFAKKARGLMCRYIIDNQIVRSKDLTSFSYEGYIYSKELSTENEIVFIR